MGRSNTESEKENIIFLKLVNWFFLDVYFLLLPFIFGVQNGKHLCPEVPRKEVLFILPSGARLWTAPKLPTLPTF